MYTYLAPEKPEKPEKYLYTPSSDRSPKRFMIASSRSNQILALKLSKIPNSVALLGQMLTASRTRTIRY